MKLELDPVADAVYFEISAAEVATTKEIEPGIIGDYDAGALGRHRGLVREHAFLIFIG
jgi:hypothetical protein